MGKTSKRARLGRDTTEGIRNTADTIAKSDVPADTEPAEQAPEPFAVWSTEEEAEKNRWQWREGPVDRTLEHFELRWGEPLKSSYDAMVIAAVVGRIREGLVNVEFLIDRGDPRKSEIIRHVVRELDFYLIELRKRDPWKYLQYHCTTTSNVYGSVHWSFLP
jgi:hypothetical protein